MSSFRKASKTKQRDHKERSQLGFRKHLGLLEKKKDYKLRADDYHRKQKTILALRKKAMDKNPDEFNFKMIHNQLQDGVHVIKPEETVMTDEQKKMMRTQDIRYVEMKRVSEMKKIERMKSELHFLDVNEEKKNKHVFYVDSKKEVKDFDLATRLNTVPALVDRVYNRPTIETLTNESVLGAVESKSIKKLSKQRKQQYLRLSERYRPRTGDVCHYSKNPDEKKIYKIRLRK
ncbi:putative U3 small nucleolar RNA-associated protein [Pimephales promelas]|nr:putative U3 small nucleolar RNA-associated protein [Pimephales promelas]